MLIAWDKICMSKNKGGLGQRKFGVVDIAFQCKLAWKVLANDFSIWVQTMIAKYIHTLVFF